MQRDAKYYYERSCMSVCPFAYHKSRISKPQDVLHSGGANTAVYDCPKNSIQSPLGLPDLPYFTRDPVFQALSPASRGGGSRREEQTSRILLVRLSRHSDDTVTRENFV